MKHVLLLGIICLFEIFGVKGNTGIGPLHVKDFGFLILVFYFFSQGQNKNKRIFNIRKIHIIHVFYIIISFTISGLINGKVVAYIISERDILYAFFVYLILNRTSSSIIFWIIKVIINITIIHSVIYIFQSYTHLLPNWDSVTHDFVGKRYTNSPPFLFLFWIFISLVPNNKKLFYSFIILVCSISTGSSMALIVTLFGIPKLIFLIKYKINYKLIVSILIIPLLIFIRNSEKFDSHLTQLMTIDKDEELISFYHQGTLNFRYGLVMERYQHISQNWKTFLFGIGYQPDFSNKEKLFVLGTENENYYWGIEQYETGDIVWASVLTRQGIVGIILYSLTFYLLFKRKFNNRLNIVDLGLLFLITLNSGMLFYFPIYIFIILFYEKKHLFSDSKYAIGGKRVIYH